MTTEENIEALRSSQTVSLNAKKATSKKESKTPASRHTNEERKANLTSSSKTDGKKPVKLHNKAKMARKDVVPCGVCKERFCDEQFHRNWIQYQNCLVWYHHECQGLPEKYTSVGFFCVQCEYISD